MIALANMALTGASSDNDNWAIQTTVGFVSTMALVNQSVVVALDMSVRMELKQNATALVEVIIGH